MICEALDRPTGQTVAIKKIPRAFEDAVDAKRTLREIETMRSTTPQHKAWVEGFLEYERRVTAALALAPSASPPRRCPATAGTPHRSYEGAWSRGRLAQPSLTKPPVWSQAPLFVLERRLEALEQLRVRSQSISE